MSVQGRYVPRDYDTRIDRFRRAEGIPLQLWADEAGMSRTQLGKYRSGKLEPTAMALADLVRAAKRIAGFPVQASDLYDLGEEEPVNVANPTPRTEPRKGRTFFDTRMDRCLVREGISPTHLAQKAGISRQSLLRKRAGRESPSISSVAMLVRAMRRMGRDIRAADLVDVGEDY